MLATIDWEGVATRWGFPIVLLIVIGFAIWRFAQFMKPHVDRVVQSHVALLDDTRNAIVDLGKALDGIATTLGEVRASTSSERAVNDARTERALNTVVDQMRQSTERTVRLLERLQDEQRLRFDLLQKLVEKPTS